MSSSAPAQNIDGYRQDMIGLEVRLANLEQLQLRIDGIDQSQSVCQQNENGDAAGGNGLALVGQFVMNITALDDRLRRLSITTGIEASGAFPLFFVEFLSILLLHLKASAQRLIKLIKNRSKTPPETTWRRCGGFNHISCQSYRACAGTSTSKSRAEAVLPQIGNVISLPVRSFF